MPSLGNIAGMVAEGAARHVIIEPPRCTEVRHRRVACRMCVEACPEQALSIANNEITLRGELCSGCGVCALVCPTQALRTASPSSQDIVLAIDELAQPVSAQLDAESKADATRSGKTTANGTQPSDLPQRPMHLEIACQHAVPSSVEARIVVPALAYVDESVLVHAAVAGFTRVSLTNCHHKECLMPALELMPDIIGLARTFFDIWRVKCEVKLRRQKPEAAKQAAGSSARSASRPPEGLGAGRDYSRRGMLTNVVSQTANLVSEAAASELRERLGVAEEPLTLSQVLTDSRGNLRKYAIPREEQLLDDLYALNPNPSGTFEARGFCRVKVVAAACTRCAICARFCTTGALEGEAAPIGSHWAASWKNPDTVDMQAEESGGSLTFRISDCVGCGLCAAVCPVHCLEIDPQVEAAHVFDLEPVNLLS